MREFKIKPIVDEEGKKLPKNMTEQFRKVQSGIEYLKMSADDVVVELKGVNHKLKDNTTDIKLISKKVNEIDNRLSDHIRNSQKESKLVQKKFDEIQKVLTSINDVVVSIAIKTMSK
jgi:predicted  nucleic acid-binding Zn-ribbon protein